MSQEEAKINSIATERTIMVPQIERVDSIMHQEKCIIRRNIFKQTANLLYARDLITLNTLRILTSLLNGIRLNKFVSRQHRMFRLVQFACTLQRQQKLQDVDMFTAGLAYCTICHYLMRNGENVQF